MKTYSTSEIGTKVKRKNYEGVKRFFTKFVFEPFGSGLFGFAIFFSVLILTKFASFLFGVQSNFDVDFNDVILSSIGFILLTVIKILENITSETNK